MLLLQLLSTYPVVSQTLRKAFSKNPSPQDSAAEKNHHCCGMGIKQGLGHADLDDLVINPRHMKITVGKLQIISASGQV